jgi:predicted Mrr-cat superfamily restriction endonuclease
MNYWLHRISHHAEASYPLLEKGHLTIGFSKVSNLEFLDKLKSGDSAYAYFEEAIVNAYGSKIRSRLSLWRFLVEMKIGDRVLVPSAGSFSIYQIEGEVSAINQLELQGVSAWNGTLMINKGVLQIGENPIDLGFFLKVSPVAKNISRYDYADADLTSRLKHRSTNADISDISTNISKALNAYNEKKPINLHHFILEKTRENLLNIIQTELNPDKFEKLVKWYFQRLGAEIIHTSKNEKDKDGDADVIAVFESLKTIYYIQAKFHNDNTSTSEWAVEQINKYREYKNESRDDEYTKISWVISSAPEFSPKCVNRAKVYSVGLFNGPEFAQMILEAGILGLDKNI